MQAGKWGNKSMAACPAFLEAIRDAWATTSGAVLELGSGLSTFTLNELNADGSRPVYSLEQSKEWFRAVYALDNVDVRYAPISGRWYEAASLDGIEGVGLVVIDGPLGDRSGIMLHRNRFADECLLLVDDATRDRKKIEKWGRGIDWEFSRAGRGIARGFWRRT